MWRLLVLHFGVLSDLSFIDFDRVGGISHMDA